MRYVLMALLVGVSLVLASGCGGGGGSKPAVKDKNDPGFKPEQPPAPPPLPKGPPK